MWHFVICKDGVLQIVPRVRDKSLLLELEKARGIGAAVGATLEAFIQASTRQVIPLKTKCHKKYFEKIRSWER